MKQLNTSTMKAYLLLRKNKQSGPWSHPELKRMGLYPSDLVWEEGVSKQWQLASEIQELKLLVQPEPKRAPVVTSCPAPLPQLFPQDSPMLMKVEPLRERLNQWEPARPVFRKKLFTIGATGKLAFVCIGLMLSAVLVRKMVDGNTVVKELPSPEYRMPAPAGTAPLAASELQNPANKKTGSTALVLSVRKP